MVNMVDFQNTPQNGRIEHIRTTHPTGGHPCSRFVPVHGLFSFCSQTCAKLEQNVNKRGTPRIPGQKRTLEQSVNKRRTPNGVTKLQHCCKYTTPMVLQNCHTVADWLCQCNSVTKVEIF